MKNNIIFVIIGLAAIAVITPLAYFVSSNQEDDSPEGVIQLIQGPKDYSVDQKLKNIDIANPNAEETLRQMQNGQYEYDQ